MKYLQVVAFLTLSCYGLYGQGERLYSETGITIGNSVSATPEPGTIRWTGTDFEGWNGTCWLSLTTGSNCPVPPTDGDGNTYSSFVICNQEWLTTDLTATTCSDGTPIPNITDDAQWSGMTSMAYSWYDNDEATQTANGFGILYNWYTTIECDICPSGYRVPTDADFIELVDCLAPTPVDPNQTGATSPGTGDMLREVGSTYWVAPNTGATNSSGWSGRGAGYRDDTPVFGTFNQLFGSGNWWTTSEDNMDRGWHRALGSGLEYVYRYPRDKSWGFQIRCIKE